MREDLGPLLEETELLRADVRLLIRHESRLRGFLQNLRDLFRRRDFDLLRFEPAPFWPDVFVKRGLPWGHFLLSGIYHVLALALVWAGSRFLALQTHATPQPMLSHADVIYYTPSEYLPPLDTRQSAATEAQKADAEFSPQPVISVPPQADNRSQTIVTLPNIHLHHDVAMPNVVALLDKMRDDPRMPIGPAPAVPASEITRLAPQMDRSVIAPPPDVRQNVDATLRQTLQAPLSAVIAPPPAVAESNRRLGDLNVGHGSVIAPAPQLSLDEQRAVPQGRSVSLPGHAEQVIAPPPSLGGSGQSRSGGSMVALSLHPAVGAPPTPLAGNRRGTFATTPEGHRGATGTPGSSTGESAAGGAGGGKANGSGSGKSGDSNLPSGLYVGKTSAPASAVAGNPAPKSNASSVNPDLIANARPPSLSRTPRAEDDDKISEAERAVFGGRKIYSLSLNMPNLNSAGGSWIIRFAALDQDPIPSHAASSDAAAPDLSSPVAMRKVDPAYPLELMRHHVGGTVILYAVIHADGTVGNVRVLRSVDERLDQFASEAIAKWQFQPATKNGAPVDVEATFWIPFRPARVGMTY